MMDIRCILHPTDFSTYSERACSVARRLARDHGSRLVLLHVAPLPKIGSEGIPVPLFPENEREALEAQLNQLRVRDASVETELRLEYGVPATTITQVACDIGADLIVIGTHERRGVRRLLLGSVAENLVRQMVCPVLVVKKRRARSLTPLSNSKERSSVNELGRQKNEEVSIFNLKTILHPTDLNESSDDAYQTACDLSRDKKAHLIALHIAPKGVVSYMDKVSERSTEETKEKLWEAVRRPREEEAGINVTHRVEDGDPVTEILRVARETNCDLIVMGTHGRTGLTRWFSSSVAEEVVHKAPCSVLIVKPPETSAHPEPDHSYEQRAEEPEDALAGQTPQLS